ncbi:MAG: glycosyltransferase family 1 protein [Siphonobacter sp.]
MQMYLPAKKKLQLPAQPYHIVESKWHKIWSPFLSNCRVWHAPFQSGRILPNKRLYPALKVVLTVHDLNVLHEGKSREIQQKSLAHTQALIDCSDVIVCISEFTRQDLLSHCDIRNKPVRVIYNGVTKLENPQAQPSGYQPEREFLLGMGYLNRKKNYRVLVPLLQANPDLELIIIGHHDDPDYVQQMQNDAEVLGVAERLKLLGAVSEADKAWYLKHCKAFLHPSLAEGFGLPVVEAMHFGKPVFLSLLTSLPEVGGKAAYYFPDFRAETIQEVYRRGMDDYEKKNRRQQIVENADRFNWQLSARQYLKVYESFL